MQTEKSSAASHDNLLGVCHALGDTFGFNPLILRLALMFGVMLAPQITIVSYLAAGFAVLVATLATRRQRKTAATGQTGSMDPVTA